MRDLGHLPTIYQLVYALDERALGRRTLVHQTGITESTVRTHLGKLRDAGYVKMAKAGTSLTAQGLGTFEPLFDLVKHVTELELSELALDRHNVAALLRRADEPFRESWRYRDAAVREGATGALLLVKRPEGWALGDDAAPLARHNPNDAAHIDERAPGPRLGDGLVISFGATPQVARAGLWRIIAELVPFEKMEGVDNT